MATKIKTIWSNAETAFILNYADVCLRQQQDYNATVAEKISSYAKRKVPIGSVKKKVYRVLSGNNATGFSGPYAKLVQEGTRHLDISSLPTDLVNEMKAQRKELGLDELSAADVPGRSIDHGPSAGASSRTALVSVSERKRKAYSN